MVECPIFVIYEMMGIVIALTGNSIHLAAYALIDNFFWIVEGILGGSAVFIRTELSMEIAKNEP